MNETNHIPLVSVGLMTSGNRGHYIGAVIEGWLAQTFKDFELIISNDNSTDNTDEVCRAYAAKDPRIKYFKQEKALRNPWCYDFVFNQARGTYFIWASDDDLWHEKFLEDCVALFKKDPELVMAFSNMVDIDRNGNVVRQLDPAKYFPFERDTYKRMKQNIVFRFNNGKNQLLYGLWRREKVLGYPLSKYTRPGTKFYWGFTNHWIARGLSRGPVGLVPEVRFYRRTREIEEYRPPRIFPARIVVTVYHRLAKIFHCPFFWLEIGFVVRVKELSLWQRAKLVFWNLYVMARLFFVRAF